MITSRRRIVGFVLCAGGLAITAGAAAADLPKSDLPKSGPPGPDLIAALQRGGLTIAMRHTSSPASAPSRAEADPGNTGLERQLDAAGRRSAADLGAAWRALRIPIGEVWSSPTFRARETVRLAGLPEPRLARELGDGGRSMQAAGPEQSAWLKAKVAEPTPAGSNRLVVTHAPNLTAAFGAEAEGLKDGEAMIFRPTAGGQARMLGRIAIEEWPKLVQR